VEPTIQGLVKFANIVRASRILIPRRLMHVHLFLKKAMEKSILNIKLPQ
jgi:hypothetical protein